MEGIWPLVILWLLFSIFGARKKKGPGARSQGPGTEAELFQSAQRAPAPGPRPLSLPDQFRAALEDLKKAEMEARGKERREIAKVFQAQPEVAMDDDEASSEDVSTVEGVADYDNEAEQVALDRRQAQSVRRQVRRSESSEGLSAEQAARRGARVDEAIGGKAQHDAWHLQLEAGEIGSDAAARPPARANPLARFADGTVRSAMIMSEILGKPKGQG